MGECGHSGLGGLVDSLLRAGVVCDLLHNLAVAFVSHDLMIATKLKKGRPNHLLCQVWKVSALPAPAGHAHSSLAK